MKLVGSTSLRNVRTGQTDGNGCVVALTGSSATLHQADAEVELAPIPFSALWHLCRGPAVCSPPGAVPAPRNRRAGFSNSPRDCHEKLVCRSVQVMWWVMKADHVVAPPRFATLSLPF